MKLILSVFLLLFISSYTLAYPQPGIVSTQTGPSPADLQAFRAATEAMRANRVDEAITDFQQITRRSPRFAEAYFNLGIALAESSRNEEALAALQRAVALKSTLRGAYLFLAISQYKLSKFEAAAVSIRKEISVSPADAKAWMWQGIIDLGLGHLAIAVADLDHASSLDPTNVDILYHRGRAALALSRQSYETMYRLEPNSWHVHQVLAEADIESSQYADAVEQLKMAIASTSPQSGLYEALGTSLWHIGKYQEAESAYETALKLDPDDTVTLYKLGCLRVDKGDAAGGQQLLERVKIADPSLKLTLYYLGRAEAALGDDLKAVEDFKALIAEDPDEGTAKQALFQLSRVYRRLHDEPASAAAQAQYRVLEQKSRDATSEKSRQRLLRADRDISIPAATLNTQEP